jgi:ribosome recycling factor
LPDRHSPAAAAAANMGAIRCKHNAAKTGNHIETLNELAHDKSREEAQERRAKKKDKKATKKNKSSTTAAAVPDEQQHDDDDDNDDMDDDDDHDDEEEGELLPNIVRVKERMQKIVVKFEESLKAIRGSEPTPELFDDVLVDAYGSMAPLKSVAQVVIVTATQATATCFDPATAKAVSTALRDKLALNPSIEEGGVVKIPLPRVSMETRQKTAAALGKKTETFRQRIRKVRRKALDVVKQGVAGKLEGVSKDDAFRVQKELEVLTDQVIQSLNDSAEKKHESIMSV